MATITGYRFTIDTDFNGIPPDHDQLQAEIAAAVGTALVEITTAGAGGSPGVTIFFADTLSAAEKTALDNAVALHPLAKTKQQKYTAIDAKTVALIEAGFTFAGKKFSLSVPSQLTLIGLELAKIDPALVYPVSYNVKGDAQDSFSIPDAVVVHGMFLTALGTYRAHKDAGTVLKNQVRAAATVGEVNAVVDNR